MNPAAGGPPVHRHDWAHEDPRVAPQTQNQPRAAGVDPGPGPHEYPEGQQNPLSWYYPVPTQTQSAAVPPVGGRLPQPQYWTPQAPLPYQYQPPRPEPLFVAVNPFEARRWRRGSPARPAQPQPESTVDAPLIPPSILSTAGARSRPAYPTAGELDARYTQPGFPLDLRRLRMAGSSPLGVDGTISGAVVPPPQPLLVHELVDSDESEDEAIVRAARPKPIRACVRCKKLKMKCEFETETGFCKRCLNGGHDCVVEGRQPRSGPRERYRPGEHPGDSHVPRPPTHPPRANSAAVEDATRYSPIDERSPANSLSSRSSIATIASAGASGLPSLSRLHLEMAAYAPPSQSTPSQPWPWPALGIGRNTGAVAPPPESPRMHLARKHALPTLFPSRSIRSRQRSSHVLDEEFGDEETDEKPLPRPPGACRRCKNLKMKCEFETETGFCKRCLSGGHDCVVLGRQPRSRPRGPRERYRPGEHPGDSRVPHPPTRPPTRLSRADSAAVEEATRYSLIDELSPENFLSSRRPAYSSASQSSIASVAPSVRSSGSHSRSPQRPETDIISAMRQRPIPIPPRPLPQRLARSSTIPYSAVNPPPAPTPYPHRGSEKVDSSALELPPPATSAIRYSKSSPLEMFIFVVPVTLFLFDFVPRQLYLHLLLRIPSLYFSRVTRIFEDARLSLPDIKRMARANADQWNTSENAIWQLSTQTPDRMPLPRSLLQFRSSWESFIDSLMREWKTFNIISVLLMSAILTMLQIEAASHPIIRTSALFSLICALMSLLYGCMYIIRFGTMRKMHKASSFATEAQKGTTSIWWNIWVLLAMPAVWLAWSIIMFLTCIMSFIWLSGSSQDPVDLVLSPRAALGPRIALTVVFLLGVIYFGLIVGTFHRYGDPLDREWMRVVNEWMKDTLDPHQNPYNAQQPSSGPFNPSFQSATRDGITSKYQHAYQTQAAAPLVRALAEEGSPAVPLEPLTKLSPSAPLTSHPSAFLKTPRPAVSQPMIPFTVMQLGHPDVEARTTGHADPTWSGAIDADDWSRFILDISSAWHGQLALTQTEDGVVSTDLPTYTLLPPPRPGNPIPTSFKSNAGPATRSVGSAESYDQKPSKYTTAGSSAPVPQSLSAEGAQMTFAKTLPHLPVEDVEPSTSRARPGEQSDPAPDPVQTVREFINLWNELYFWPRYLEASLEVRKPHDSSDPVFAVNLAARSFTSFLKPRKYLPYGPNDPWQLMNHMSDLPAA